MGKGHGKRVQQHFRGKHTNQHLANIIKKAEGTLPHKIVFESIHEQEAFAEEQRLIKLLGRSDLDLGPLCNLTDGGEGTCGAVKTAEDRAAISARMTGSPRSAEYRAKISATLTGRKQSPEVVKRRAETLRQLACQPDYILACADRAKRRWQDPIFRQKIILAAKARVNTPGGAEQLRRARLGFRMGNKEAYKQADDLLDTYVHGLALTLGDNKQF